MTRTPGGSCHSCAQLLPLIPPLLPVFSYNLSTLHRLSCLLVYSLDLKENEDYDSKVLEETILFKKLDFGWISCIIVVVQAIQQVQKYFWLEAAEHEHYARIYSSINRGSIYPFHSQLLFFPNSIPFCKRNASICHS